MTLSEIRTFVKNNYRLANTELDTVLDGNINEAWREIATEHWWPALLKGSSFTTTSAQAYSLPSDFFRLVPNSVRYNVTSASPGAIIEDVSVQDIVLFDAYVPLTGPGACCVRSTGTTTGKELYFAPSWSATGYAVNYRYLKQPATMSSDSNQPEELSIGNAICWRALMTMALYHGKGDDADRFERLYRRAMSGAKMQAGNLV